MPDGIIKKLESALKAVAESLGLGVLVMGGSKPSDHEVMMQLAELFPKLCKEGNKHADEAVVHLQTLFKDHQLSWSALTIHGAFVGAGLMHGKHSHNHGHRHYDGEETSEMMLGAMAYAYKKEYESDLAKMEAQVKV